ncbi:MAG: hypothetical protein ACTSR2_09985 [Candidatus Hodarchaeales archaeon]
MKIPVPMKFEEFRKLSIDDQLDFFLEYFTDKTIAFFIERLRKEGTIPFSSKASSRSSYHLIKIALEIFEFEAPEDKIPEDIDALTGVKLKDPNKILYEWSNTSPFESKLPEIEFIPNGAHMPEGSFTWKIAIPDAIDLYYLPLKKKEMKTLNLVFQSVNVTGD